MVAARFVLLCNARLHILPAPVSASYTSLAKYQLMTQPENQASEIPNRRTFLQNAVSASAAIAGGGLLSGCASGQSTVGAQTAAGAQSPRAATDATNESLWDMSWQNRLGRYKMAYDVPDPQKGDAYDVIASTIVGYKAAFPVSAKEFTPVLVLRHTSVIAAVNDAMWKRLKCSERLTEKATSAKVADRNPFLVYIDRERSFVTADSSIDV